MSGDESAPDQQPLPPSFVALHVPPGRLKPTATRAQMLERYGWCEDLAQMLTETALNQRHALHITETDVLQRIARGLAADPATTSPAEARWVLTRLAELLGWPLPAPSPEHGPGTGR